MSTYYTYEFISPESLYAEIKAEMRSYFNTGVLIDTMFPIYTRYCLRRFYRSTYDIDETIIKLDNYSAELPLGFKYVREVWACTNVTETRRMPGAIYHQETCVVSPYGDYDRCNPCDTCIDDCNTEKKIYFKTTEFFHYTYSISHLLRPGNLQVKDHCAEDCLNLHERVHDKDTFDIRGGRMYTNYCDGHIRLIYYKDPIDDCDSEVPIPDNFYIREYIKAYIKYKLYEQLYNEVTDETFNQIAQKYQLYKQEYNDAYINADAEVKKQTMYQKRESIRRMKHRLDKYIIR